MNRTRFHSLMPSSHLACDGSTEPVSCPFSLSVRPPRGLRTEAGGGCEIFVWIHGLDPRPLRFCLVGSYTNLKNRKSV